MATRTPLIGWRGRLFFSRSRNENQLSLSDLGVGILRRVAAGGVDQHRLFGEPPVAVARAADARDRRGRRAARQRKFQAGIDQRRGLAGAGRADDDVPRQIVEIAGLAAARGLQRRERILHPLLEHRLVVDCLFARR